MKSLSQFLVLLLAAVGVPAQNPPQQTESTPLYRITVVGHTTKAINYRHRGGSTRLNMRGTALLPEARGEVKVESHTGRIAIETNLDRLQPASRFGPEYLTYVLWAITPEGRAANLGEVLLHDGKSEMQVTTDLQVFGLVVTAEPYFAVTQPSDAVVMENEVRKDTEGQVEEIEAKYELLPRGQYTLNVKPSELRPMALDRRVPLELYEARNAVQIARWAGAAGYAKESFAKAELALKQAEDYQARKAGRKPVTTAAREAAQMAEDARVIALKRQREEFEARQRQASQEREAQARAEAEAEAQRRAQAEASQRAEAERRAQAEAERSAAQARQQAAQAEAENARRQAEESERQRQKAEQEKVELRAQMLRQLNLILETRETARGLVVNMSDVLFDSGKATLQPGARERLARIGAILLAHPGLKLEVEGHTDSVGSDAMNQALSEKRALSVRDYLVLQGIPLESITARGFGKTQPVASNDNSVGRARNRRVELIVSGDVIGVQVGTITVRP